MNRINKLFRWQMLLLVAFAMILGTQDALAQRSMVTGKVTDGLGLPLPGVSIMIKGSTTGVISGPDGKYSIEVPDQNAVLTFQFLGYLTHEAPVAGKPVMDITLNELVSSIDEVVVTALGIRSDKKALGYAMAEVQGDAIVNVKSSNFVNSLQGKVAGVQISNP